MYKNLGCIKRNLLILIAFIVIKADGLKLTSIEVPAAVMNSSQVVLVCNYVLEGDQLYSVKWYKNYVEFYRFQPIVSESSTLANTVPATASNDEQAEMEAKQGFELDGIYLDLSNCNSSHVHLKQVSLASEGTFKCEVSADSPSFATVSMERQMKVYVLAKQKLSIVDNSRLASTEQIEFRPPQVRTSLSAQSQSYYLDDYINLTCFSGPSRPAAKLSWLVNDTPIVNSSKWLIHPPEKVSNNSEQLLANSLTLAFKIGPQHLFTNATDIDTLEQQPYGRYSRQHSLKQFKLSCISRLIVEFSSEAETLVLGGKTTKKRTSFSENQLQQAEQLRAKWEVLKSRQQSNLSEMNKDFSEYKWPRAQSGKLRPVPMRPPKSDNSQESVNEHPFKGNLMKQQQQTGTFVVWTSQQLKLQAEFIREVLHSTHPNELEEPIIEANTQSNFLNFNVTPKLVKISSKLESEKDKTSGSEAEKLLNLQSESFEPNDVVRFTCVPRFKPSTRVELGKKVSTNWYLNNKEISSSQVDAFDGDNFFQDKSLGWSIELNQGASRKNTTDQSHLFIRFTSSLFQLKELSLKCKTMIEQPLIEFEAQFIASVMLNPQLVRPNTRYMTRKQVLGSGDGRKRGRNIVTWPQNSQPIGKLSPSSKSSSTSSTTRSVPLITFFSANLLLLSLSIFRFKIT